MNRNPTDGINLDHAATTPVRPEAAEAMLLCLRQCANPSSLHAAGRAGREVLDSARDRLATVISCTAAEIIFTSGGTESDNLAIIGGSRMSPEKTHILVSAVEHHAVLHAADSLRAVCREVEIIPADRQGQVLPETVQSMLRPETALVSVMMANNEIGAVQAVAEIARICRQNGTLFHTDAVQALGHIPVDVQELGVDLLSLSAHKFGGPPGAGALYVREGLEIRPTLFGGAQERGRRGGTENWPAIAGMDAALRVGQPFWQEDDQPDGPPSEWARERELVRRLRSALSTIPDTWFNTAGEESDQPLGITMAPPAKLPNILSVGFRGVRAETLLLGLDLEGVAASSGSACASGSIEPSHVLKAIGLTPEEANSSIRFSVGWTTTHEEIDRAAEIVERVVARARLAQLL